MSTAFNDNNAWVDGAGRLTLGNGGRDDGAGDATNPYAKGDVFISIPLTALYATGGAAAVARAGAGLYTLNLTGAATAYAIGIPLAWFQRKFTNVIGGSQNPHGFKITDLVIGYTVATAVLGAAPAVAFFTELQTNAVARAVTATPFGAVTYENPIGTVVAGPPTAVAATPVVFRAVPAAPIFVNGDNTFALAELTLTTGAAAAAAITFVGAHISLALY